MGVSKESLVIIVYIPNIFLLFFCDFYIFFMFMLLYVSVFECLFMSRVFVHLSVSYPNLNICLRGLKMMNAHNFLIVFPCNIGER